MICATRLVMMVADYRERMAGFGIGLDALRAVPGSFTANCHITTDLDDNQITSFHAGAMFQSQVNDVTAVDNIALGIVAPDGRDGIQACTRLCVKRSVHLRSGPDDAGVLGRRDCQTIGMADYLSVNDYEAEMIAQKTGRAIESFAPGLEGVDRHARRTGLTRVRGRAE